MEVSPIFCSNEYIPLLVYKEHNIFLINIPYNMKLSAVFDYINTTTWIDDTSNDVIERIAKQFCDSLPPTFTSKKIIHRIGGQSGSGKTTQVSRAILNTCLTHNEQPLVIAVRTFSTLHPKYNELLSQFGQQLIREKTNGFALKCLCCAVKLAVQRGFLLILEVTLLHPVFEQFIADLCIENEYDINFHILSVNKSISNILIRKRETGVTGLEYGRIITPSSSLYFYKILPVGMKFWIKKYPYFYCIMWNAFDSLPCYMGQIGCCEKFFAEHRKKIAPFYFSEQELLASKETFYTQLLYNH